MKIHWFLPGLISVLWLASPVLAGELTSWQFDESQNLLEFNTDESVQPRAQLVLDPTRLVIDLPGTTPGAVQANQLVGGAVQQVRIGQYDAQTTRIVVELAPGYAIDPQQIQFRGISPTQWTVQLPEPQYVSLPISETPSESSVTSPSRSPSPPINAAITPPSATPSTAPLPSPAPSPVPASSPSPTPMVEAATQVEGLRVTDDGLFVQISGAQPEIDLERSRDRRSITLSIENAVLSPQLTEREMSIDRYGISRLQFTQTTDDPPIVRITLTINPDHSNWQATVSGLGGIVLLPPREAEATARVNPREESREERREESRREESRREESRETEEPSDASESSSTSFVAVIQGIELDPSGTQLLIQSDRPVSYTGRWQSGMYQILLSPAQLAEQVSGPELGADSPLLRVRLRQENDDTVMISIQPAAGVRFGELNAVSSQLLALDLQRSQPSPTLPPNTATTPPSRSNSDISLPSIPSGRLVVVIDPGHGGEDVGAVGINGLREADVVLPIAQQLATLLQQQGIQVIMTRTDDREVELEPRVQLAEQANATLFVSIHANSMGMDRPDINGAETYYYSSGAGLAQTIQTSIVGNLDMTDRGVRQARFYVLRRTSMPAVLVEIGFVTGSEDAPRLSDSEFQSQMAAAIAQGILQYIQQNSTANTEESGGG
ncbi:MAG: N-acetylmuramoyl-L-alanine amidase [Cyanobacteria bacterium CRU_2_1]|nr:N-acetylmuramoyl-L-alanine amidase [Cyanobacteria bacterium CRU_2_1]